MKIGLIVFSLILINSLFAQISPNGNQIDTTWWYPHYSNGLEYLDSNDLEAAEIELRKILEKDENVAYAYFGLGRVYGKKEDGGETAEESFEMAIEIDPDLIEAYYYLGLIHEKKGIMGRSSSIDCFEAAVEKNPHFIDGWIAWARVEENLRWPWELPFDTEPLEILTNALEVNSSDKKLYERYKKFLFWYSFEEISIPTFKYLLKQNPSNSEYAIDFVKLLYNLDMYESCLNVLDSIKISYTDYSPCRIKLLQAKILFNTDEEDKGLDYYWQAINSIRDSLDVNEIYSDICYIINNREFEEYQSISTTDLPDFYARFWHSRDPNLATMANERLAEHYKRLKFAWKYYRRYESDESNKSVYIYKSEHPLNGIMNIKLGDEFLNPFVSNALLVNRALDDMGLIYLRHGEADNFGVYICDSCPQNLSWKYFANYNRQEIIFHFRKYGDNRGWLMESLPGYFQNRGDFGGHYAQLEHSLSQNQDINYNIWMYEELNEENIEHVDVGLKTETTGFVYENTLIEFPLELLSFKDENFNTRIDLYYGISGENFTLDNSEQKNFLFYVTFLGIYDSTWTEIIRENYTQRIPLPVSQDEWEEMAIVETAGFSLHPGDYNFEMQLQDKMSDNLGVYKGLFTIPNYWTNELMLSDIILSDPVIRKTEPTRFKRGDISFNPHMFTAFEEKETVGIYFEIYNLLFDFGDRTNFEVNWWLEEVGEDEAESEAVRSNLPYSGKSRDDNIYFNLDLSDTDSGEYELVVLVKDSTSGAEVKKKVLLTVL